MSELLSNTRQGIFKLEDPRGTLATIDYSTDFDVNLYDLDDGSRDAGHDGGANIADGTYALGKSYSGKKSMTKTFMTDFQNSGVATTYPKWWKFLEACGFVLSDDTVNAFATWHGRPACKGISGEFPLWRCGVDGSTTGDAQVMAGGAGTFSFGADSVGAVIRPSFTITGKDGGIKALSAGSFQKPSGVDTTDTEVFLGHTIVMGGYTYKVWSFQFDMQGDVQSNDNSADVTNGVKTGIDHFTVVNANIQATMTIERVGIAENNPVEDLFNNTVYSNIVYTMNGFEITFNTAQNIDVQDTTTNEQGSQELTVKINTMQIKQL